MLLDISSFATLKKWNYKIDINISILMNYVNQFKFEIIHKNYNMS